MVGRYFLRRQSLPVFACLFLATVAFTQVQRRHARSLTPATPEAAAQWAQQ
jgi:hypothetical protein